MSIKTLHGQMSVVDKNGNAQKLHQETSAEDVLVTRTTNIQGTDGASAIPSDVDNVQKLADKVGALAFKSKVGYDDLSDDLIAKDISTATDTQIPSVTVVKEFVAEVDEKISTFEDTMIDGNYVVVDETTEEINPPDSEINDDVTSTSLTWSSNKINSQLTDVINKIEEVNEAANRVFYIALVKDSNDTYIAQKTVAEIEAAYKENKAIWVVASDVLLPLRKRQDANTWIFSGYTETQAYDITITATVVTVTYNDLVTANGALPNPNVLKLTGAVNAVYDGSEEVEVEIPTGSSGVVGATINIKNWTVSDMS